MVDGLLLLRCAVVVEVLDIVFQIGIEHLFIALHIVVHHFLLFGLHLLFVFKAGGAKPCVVAGEGPHKGSTDLTGLDFGVLVLLVSELNQLSGAGVKGVFVIRHQQVLLLGKVAKEKGRLAVTLLAIAINPKAFCGQGTVIHLTESVDFTLK